MKTVTKNATPFETRIKLPDESREQVMGVLNKLLATLSDLYSQTKHAHWNVKGPNFIGLHKLFDEMAEGVETIVDEVAERITALGGVAFGTIQAASASSELEDFPSDVSRSAEVVATLADRYGQTGNACRNGITIADDAGDAGTADLLTQASRQLDQFLYFLDAHTG